MAMDTQHSTSVEQRKASFNGLPQPLVRFMGAQFEKCNTGANAAKVKLIRQLLHTASEARTRLIMLNRKKGDLSEEQQAAWDTDIKACIDSVTQANSMFGEIEKPKTFKLKAVGDTVALEERNDAEELIRLAGRMKRRSETVQALGEAAATADESQIDAVANVLESYLPGTASADSQSSTVQVRGLP